MEDPLAVIGSKARLNILRNLSRRDMYVSEIMENVGLDGKTAKHHLDLLEERNIVSSRNEGRRRYYSLDGEVVLRISPSPERTFVAQLPEGTTDNDGNS